MALTTTTATAAIAATDNQITVASATGFGPGYQLKVNAEVMKVSTGYVSGTTIPVLRGLSGTATQAHAVTSNVVAGVPGDFAESAPVGAVNYPAIRVRIVRSYNAAGAIALPTPGNDMLAIINGTVARALTLAAPTTDMDGDEMVIVANGKAAHTVTISGGIGAAGSGYTVATFTTGAQQTLALLACNGAWCQKQSHFSGTLTAILIALA
jgi:hypothetical protein